MALKPGILSLKSTSLTTFLILRDLVHQAQEVRKYVLGKGKPLMDAQHGSDTPRSNVCNDMTTLVIWKIDFSVFLVCVLGAGRRQEGVRAQSPEPQ